jgi:hypothetical protein
VAHPDVPQVDLMPYGVPIPELDTALRARMVAFAGLTALVASKPASQGGGPAIYADGESYQGQTFPYLLIGAWELVPLNNLSPGDDGFGWNITLQIKAVGQKTEAPLYAVINQVAKSLPNGSALTVSGWSFGQIAELVPHSPIKTVQAGVTTVEIPAILRVRVYS